MAAETSRHTNPQKFAKYRLIFFKPTGCTSLHRRKASRIGVTVLAFWFRGWPPADHFDLYLLVAFNSRLDPVRGPEGPGHAWRVVAEPKGPLRSKKDEPAIPVAPAF